MSKFEQIQVKLQYVLPKHFISRVMGKFASARLGVLTQLFMRWFIKHYKVDMSEADREDPRDYASFNEFFTRALKADARPLTTDDDEIAHPVDGTISQLGEIDDDTLVQAKHHNYKLSALLASEEDADQFDDGQFATIYLAPRDYHRIHMPLAGTLRSMTYVPGDLFSVNPSTAEQIPDLFARNERVVCIFDSEHGPFSMTLVGATIVASIETVWAGTVTPPGGPRVHRWNYPASGPRAVSLAKGQEMGRFKLGSTVILTFADNMMFFEEDLEPGKTTRMGQVLGQLID